MHHKSNSAIRTGFFIAIALWVIYSPGESFAQIETGLQSKTSHLDGWVGLCTDLDRTRKVFEIHNEKGFAEIYHEIWRYFKNEIKI